MYGGYFGQFSGLKVERWPRNPVYPPAFPNYTRRKKETEIAVDSRGKINEDSSFEPYPPPCLGGDLILAAPIIGQMTHKCRPSAE